MSTFELFVIAIAIAGANGGLLCWMISRRQRVYAWIKSRRRQR